MRSWCVLVSLHNLVNIPPTACEDPHRRFTVEVRQVNAGASGHVPQDIPSSTFAVSEVVESTPKVFEIRLDEPRRGEKAKGCARVWRCASDVVDVVVQVREGGRLVGSSTTFPVSVKAVVEDTKLTTRVIGTEMGQVGVSFAVDPADKAGFKVRLESFLKRHNPRGLHVMQAVVDVVPEIAAFTKLYRKYGIRDYDKRLTEFFSMYGPEYTRDIPALLKQWENREEELMRNLILDNGPELCDVDVDKRITAFLTHYRLSRHDPSVASLLHRHKGDAVSLFADLTSRYGKEPDPRNYLFPTTHYEPEVGTPATSSARGTRHTRSPTETRPWDASPAPLRPPPQPFPDLVHPPKGNTLTTGRSATAGEPTPSGNANYLSLIGAPGASSPDRRAESSSPGRNAPPNHREGFYGDTVFDDDTPARDQPSRHTEERDVVPNQKVISATKEARLPNSEGALPPATEDDVRGAAPASRSSLWLRFLTLLRTSGQQDALLPGYFHYTSEQSFKELVEALDAFSRDERAVLLAEWQQLCREALEETRMDNSSPGYDAAVAEAAQVSGLHPVQLQVTSLMSFLHKEHYKYFNARLAASKEPKTERLVLVGDFDRLLDVARHGLSGARLTQQEGGTDPAAVFVRRPFAKWRQAKGTCFLVCDVIVGRSYTRNPPARLPHSGTRAFLEQYDSSVFQAAEGELSIAVYDGRQVLPHLLVQATVDPLLAACPAHPGRPVEYYVVSENDVACSRCVVMGRYKGQEVLPIEEAATQARGRLAEMQHAAESVEEAMSSFDKQLREEEARMPTAPRRIQAQREIEKIRREAEARIAKIVDEIEELDRAQKERIRADQKEMEAVRELARELSKELEEAQGVANHMSVVQALQRAKHDGALDALLTRIQERIPEAPIEKVHPFRDEEAMAPAQKRLEMRADASTQGVAADRSARNPSNFGGAARQQRNPRSDPYNTSAFMETPPKLPPPQPRGYPQGGLVTTPAEDMYTKYQSVSPGIDAQESLRSRRPPVPHRGLGGQNQLSQPPPFPWTGSHAEQAAPPLSGADATSERSSMSGTSSHAVASASAPKTSRQGGGKAALTQGWSLLHKGDEAGAAEVWRAVEAAHGEDQVEGAKARAYLAEAIDKDYETAARWYAHCLELDPNDRLTAYNYGVLLEALLRRPDEAVRLYERAAALGDHVAAARAA